MYIKRATPSNSFLGQCPPSHTADSQHSADAQQRRNWTTEGETTRKKGKKKSKKTGSQKCGRAVSVRAASKPHTKTPIGCAFIACNHKRASGEHRATPFTSCWQRSWLPQ